MKVKELLEYLNKFYDKKSNDDAKVVLLINGKYQETEDAYFELGDLIIELKEED